MLYLIIISPFVLPRETTAIWVSVTVPYDQPPGHYEGQIIVTAVKPDAEYASFHVLSFFYAS